MREGVIDLDAKARRAVKRVFATLKTSYPAWYEKHYGHEQAERLAKRIWITGVRPLTDAQVDRGLQRMVLDADFPPSLKEFIQLCRRVDGLPDARGAWGQALAGRYEHDAVRVAARLTGTYDLRRSRHDNKALFAQFERNYAIVLRRLENGEPLDGQVLTGISHDSQKSAADRAQEQAEQQLRHRIKAQGIPQDGAEARQALLARLGIGRSSPA